MKERPATLFFHGTLADLLRRDDPGTDARGVVIYPVTRRASIKDVIEALGPPHTEVGSIEADGREVGFGHQLEPGEEVNVRPLAPPFDVLRPSPLRPEPLPRIAFAVDANVGRLAALLRTLGFDTFYDPTLDDAPLAELAAREGRIVLSKDRSLLKRSLVVFGCLIRADDPRHQLREVLRLFGLRPPYHLFSRCLLCNALLEPVPKAEIMHRLLPLTRRHYSDFHRCPRCDKLYWPGSHHEHVLERMEEICRDLFAENADSDTAPRPE
ncbi:MAG: Mut7-C RNAse domain-containing protein [Desulfomicrobium sp.]